MLHARSASWKRSPKRLRPRRDGAAGRSDVVALRRHGVAIVQMPRPWVAAMMYEAFGLNWRSFTEAFGRFAPSRVHVPPCRFDEIITPMSLARTRRPLGVATRSSAGASG